MEILINNTSAFLKLKQDSFLYFIFNPKTSIPIFTELFLLRMYVKIGQSVNRDVSLIINEQAKILNNTVDCCKIVDKRIPSKTILAIGGYCPTIEPRISAFDPNTQTWVDIPEEYCKGMPNLYYHKSLQVNRDIYFVGGCTVNGMPLDTATKWDMDDFSWSPLPRMFHRRNFLSLESYGNRHIYAIGGSNGRQRLKNVEVFDIHHQCWKPASKMNFARSDGTSVFIDNHIYAIGGYNGQFVQNSVEFYDVTKDEWYIFGSSMKHFRRGHSAVGIQNCIYVAGGFGSHRLNSLEMIDIREGKWHFLNPMFKSRSNFSMSKFECGMYALGGCDQQSSIIDDSEKYDIIAGKWKPCSSLKYKLSAHSSIVLEYDTAIKSLLNYNL
uniref:Kelch-like protein 10 n=1 Tax=Parastrongyloides trichosuri TaxID=131310 RepID=A0A0N4ZSZ2_PARTI